MYSDQLLDHFQRPRNVGVLESPDVSAQAENPACGDVMRLTLRVTEGRIQQARYQVRGCVASIACGSALTETLIGKTVSEVQIMTREALVEMLGGLPNESIHASHLAIDCLKLALKQLAK